MHVLLESHDYWCPSIRDLNATWQSPSHSLLLYAVVPFCFLSFLFSVTNSDVWFCLVSSTLEVIVRASNLHEGYRHLNLIMSAMPLR